MYAKEKKKKKKKTIFSVWGENGSIDEYNRQSLKEEEEEGECCD
jgi:hypothetical protein